MCSLTLALAGVTTGLQMAGQYQQSRAQAAAYEAQAQSAQYQAEAQAESARLQAESARLQAKYEQQQADAEYQNARIQNRKGEQMAEQYAEQQRKLDARRRLAVAQQTAQAGASGITGGLGSSLDIYNASMDAYSQDSLSLLNNQRNTMYDNYLQEVNLRNQGNAMVAQSANTKNQATMFDNQAEDTLYQGRVQAANLRAQASAAKSMGNIAMVGTLLGGAASMYGMSGAGGASSGGNSAFYGGSQAGGAGYITGTPAVNSAWGSATAGFGSGVNGFSVLNRSYKSVWG